MLKPKVNKDDVVAFLKEYISSEQDFLQQLKQKKCQLAEYLPQIEEKQTKTDAANGSNNTSF